MVAARRRPGFARRALRALVVGLVVVGLGIAVAVATMDRWLFVVLDPGAFDPSLTPAAPDYEVEGAWAALPEAPGGADVALPESPAVDPAIAAADVFYVHPTTWVGDRWNAAIDDPAVVEATRRGAALIQASAFNACCAVYAPRYRQANGRAFLYPDAAGDRAVEVAYADVCAAFDRFLERTGERPFILAGHSQGAILATRLLRERIVGQALARRLVAAYLPGAPVRLEALEGMPACGEPTSTGCVVSWHARGPGYERNGLEFDAEDPDTMTGRLCVNPITWSTDGGHAAAEQGAGALFFDADSPAIKPAFADAQCVGGSLIITTHGDLERDLMSRLLLWVMGPENYHPVEYQLYYLDIRRNAVARVEAFVARQEPRGGP